MTSPASVAVDILGMGNRLINFLKEAKIELKKVTWPTREEIIRYTLTVIVITSAIAVFLGGLDYVFQYLLNNFVL